MAIKKIRTDSQESCVFTGTLRDNLTLATPIANDAAILRALQAVAAEGNSMRDLAGVVSFLVGRVAVWH